MADDRREDWADEDRPDESEDEDLPEHAGRILLGVLVFVVLVVGVGLWLVS